MSSTKSKQEQLDYTESTEDGYPVRIVTDDKGKYLVGVRRLCLPCQMRYSIEGKLTPIRQCTDCQRLQTLDRMD